jgi:hypothetical protein
MQNKWKGLVRQPEMTCSSNSRRRPSGARIWSVYRWSICQSEEHKYVTIGFCCVLQTSVMDIWWRSDISYWETTSPDILHKFQPHRTEKLRASKGYSTDHNKGWVSGVIRYRYVRILSRPLHYFSHSLPHFLSASDTSTWSVLTISLINCVWNIFETASQPCSDVDGYVIITVSA